MTLAPFNAHSEAGQRPFGTRSSTPCDPGSSVDFREKQIQGNSDLLTSEMVALQAICDLFRNDWFHQAWIIQEVAIANRPPVIRYGNVNISWNKVMMIAEWILARGFITHLAKLSAAERPAVHRAAGQDRQQPVVPRARGVDH